MSLRARAAAAAAFGAALAACVPIPMRAWQLGGGVSIAAVDTNYSALGDQTADGVAMTASAEFAEAWWLDAFMSLGHHLDTGATENIYYPPDHADYSVVSVGVRKAFPVSNEPRWTPWVHAGLGVGDVMWDTYYYDVSGVGLALGGGIDRRLGSWPLALRAQVLRQTFSGEDTYGHGPYRVTGTVGAVLLVWTFGEEDASDH